MSPFLLSPNTPAGCALSGAGPVGFAEHGPRVVSENSALGHVVRRLVREAANPNVTHLAEFESALDYEAPK